MAKGQKVTPGPPPSTGGDGGGDTGRGLTGFRQYNPDGSWTVIPFGDSQPIGGMPRFSGDILGDPNGWKIPLYYDGDENDPFNRPADEAYSLQLALVRAGYMGKGSLSDAWTGTASNAYKRALEDANRYGVSINELLGGIASGGGSGGGGGGGGSLGPAPISDEDITALAQKVSQTLLGRDLRPDEVGNFIPAFRGVYEAQLTTPQVGAENIIRKEVAPQGEADAHQVGGVMNVLAKALGG